MRVGINASVKKRDSKGIKGMEEREADMFPKEEEEEKSFLLPTNDS